MARNLKDRTLALAGLFQAAELVSRVDRRQRAGPFQQALAGEDREEIVLPRDLGGQVDERRRRGVEADQMGLRKRPRARALIERLGEPREGIVETQIVQTQHPRSMRPAAAPINPKSQGLILLASDHGHDGLAGDGQVFYSCST